MSLSPRENPLRDRARDKCRDRLGVPSLLLQLHKDAGWPDVLFLVPGGRPVLMEFKRSGKELEPLQAERKRDLQKLGYDVLGPVDNVEVAVQLVQEAVVRARRIKWNGHSCLWQTYA